MDCSTTPRALRACYALPAVAIVAAVAMLLLGLGTPAPARADAAGVGTPWVVTVGDSFISGEAGRWAGNTDRGHTRIDALGQSAYYDNPGHTAELIRGCHRSRSAEAYIGGVVKGENLACSGAQTSSFESDGKFKPGIDFAHFFAHPGWEGQALMLEKFAKTHNVKLVPISIGGNNFKFSNIVKACVEDFLISLPFLPIYCHNKKPVTEELAPVNVARQQAAIKGAILNVVKAMTNAGYTSAQYTILVQDYPSPIPNGADIRYSQKGFVRQRVGGCGLWDRDANAVDAMMLPTIDRAVFNAAKEAKLLDLKMMDISSAFNGRRLCEKGVGLLEEKGLSSWRDAGAVDKTEWVNQVRTLSTVFSPYELQEDLHPNYWGQLALRNCVTQAYNAGTPKGGTCTISGTGLNSAGEPNMLLG